jgi:hypothetical protein
LSGALPAPRSYALRSPLHALQSARNANVIHSCNHVFNIARSARLSTLKHKTLTP